MKAFDFDHHLIDSYDRFSRSFTSIRAEDLSLEVSTAVQKSTTGRRKTGPVAGALTT